MLSSFETSFGTDVSVSTTDEITEIIKEGEECVKQYGTDVKALNKRLQLIHASINLEDNSQPGPPDDPTLSQLVEKSRQVAIDGKQLEGHVQILEQEAATFHGWASSATLGYMEYLKDLNEPELREFSRDFLPQDDFEAMMRVIRARNQNPDVLKGDVGGKTIPDSQLMWEEQELEQENQKLKATIEELKETAKQHNKEEGWWKTHCAETQNMLDQARKAHDVKIKELSDSEADATLRAQTLQATLDEELRTTKGNLEARSEAEKKIEQLKLENRRLETRLRERPLKQEIHRSDRPAQGGEEQQQLSATRAIFRLFESTTMSQSSKPPVSTIWTFLPSWLGDDTISLLSGPTSAPSMGLQSQAAADVKVLAMTLYSLTLGDLGFLTSDYALSLLSHLSKLAGEASETQPKWIAFVLNEVVSRLLTAPVAAWNDERYPLPAICIAAGLLLHNLISRWSSDCGPCLANAQISLEAILGDAARCQRLSKQTLSALKRGATAVPYYAAKQGLLYAEEKLAFVSHIQNVDFFIIDLESTTIRLVSRSRAHVTPFGITPALASVSPHSPDAGLKMPISNYEQGYWWAHHSPPHAV